MVKKNVKVESCTATDLAGLNNALAHLRRLYMHFIADEAMEFNLGIAIEHVEHARKRLEEKI